MAITTFATIQRDFMTGHVFLTKLYGKHKNCFKETFS